MAIAELRMKKRRVIDIWLVSVVLIGLCNAKCYRKGRARKCLPPFGNAVFGKTIQATNTCGTPAEEYCIRTGATGDIATCLICNSEHPYKRHDATSLTDIYNSGGTRWQSSTMLKDVQFPNMINLTLDLRKTFDITSVRIRFVTSRPESFAIYKKKCGECDWQPFQYYSGSCLATYNVSNGEIVTVDDEQKVLCTDDFSDILPLRRGNIEFNTVTSRPSIYDNDSPILLDWMKAVAIRISLNRINTFGDEVFRDPRILKSYFYAISDIAVLGRCSCNGHASSCRVSSRNNILRCRCRHNTAGRDCERCKKIFNDRPWMRATKNNPGPCQACNCNNHATECSFDQAVYEATGGVSGGVCENCQHNTVGRNCESCAPYYYQDPLKDISDPTVCAPCACSVLGTDRSFCVDDQCQCDVTTGQCPCLPNVSGRNCDQCEPNHWRLASGAGCEACDCNLANSNGPTCNEHTGQCQCVEGFGGRTCLIHLNNRNNGCAGGSCFPSTGDLLVGRGHMLSASSTCGDNGPEPFYIVSHLKNVQKWFTCDASQPDRSHEVQNVITTFNDRLETWWQSQSREQEVSIQLDLEAEFQFTHMIMTFKTFRPAAMFIERSMDFGKTWAIYRYFAYDCDKSYPGIPEWPPREIDDVICDSRYSFIEPSNGGEVIYGVVEPFIAIDDPYAPRIQNLLKITNLRFNFTELHTLGYHLLDSRSDIKSKYYYALYELIVRGNCFCYGHADVCTPIEGSHQDSDVNNVMVHGRCQCQHNTQGLNCEQCLPFYQDQPWRPAEAGMPHECQLCNCNNHATECSFDQAVYEATGGVSGGVCENCQHNTVGRNCESCAPYYYQDPLKDIRDPTVCAPCECEVSGSLDGGICDAETNADLGMIAGQCRCKQYVEGPRCNQCRPGYYGLDPEDPNGCTACACNVFGTDRSFCVDDQCQCDVTTGQCPCLPNVSGRNCDQCEPNHWRLASGAGCEACDCNLANSNGPTCNEYTGQCQCVEGFGGRTCNDCADGHCGNPNIPNNGTRDYCSSEASCSDENSQCVNYDHGHCCRCRAGFYGNGKICLKNGQEVKIIGHVTGRVDVISPDGSIRRTSISRVLFSGHVMSTGRVYTHLYATPGLGRALQPISPIGDVGGWLFAVPTPPAINGFQFTGGSLQRQVSIAYHTGGYRFDVRQIFFGVQEQDNAKVLIFNTNFVGKLPYIPPSALVNVASYEENYVKAATGQISATSARNYTVNGNEYSYNVSQSIIFNECGDSFTNVSNELKLSVSAILSVYSDNVIRNAVTAKITVPAVAACTSNPCENNGACMLTDDEPGYACECLQGFRGDTCQEMFGVIIPSVDPIRAGVSFILECRMPQDVASTIFWRRNGEAVANGVMQTAILEGGRKLRIFHVTYLLAGEYDCQFSINNREVVASYFLTVETPPAQVCGKALGMNERTRQREARIFGGHVTPPSAAPFMVILYKTTPDPTYVMPGMFCGASLIDTRKLITAAHCVRHLLAEEIRVYAGKLSVNVNEIERYQQSAQVSSILLHPDYVVRTFHADYAILTLRTPLAFTMGVKPICVPRSDDKHEDIKPRPYRNRKPKYGLVFGWGYINQYQRSRVLREIKLPIRRHVYCKRIYDITSLMFCAGGETTMDACRGDSGGPFALWSTRTKTWSIAGIVSWGEGCGIVGRPGVYARVSKNVRSWIYNNTNLE